MPCPKADRRPCPGCGMLTFVCAYCERRVHSTGHKGKAIRLNPNEPLLSDYAVCGRCAAELHKAIAEGRLGPPN